jgi:DNA-binding MarR family transcriptional regulator/GNAT superfamily N-acetyltransferase
MATPTDRIAAVRAFNRFYTRRIGVLQEGLLRTRFTLTESRLLWELAHRDATTATELGRELDLDPGYLSRLLRGFKERGLVRTARSKDDARRVHLSLTQAGRRALAPLDRRSQQEAGRLIEALSESEQQSLLQAMRTIGHLLGASAADRRPFMLRPHGPGDIGWVISRHGALYAQEYGWDMTFEALVGHIASRFVERYDAARERCWIAERDGANVGSVFLVQARDEKTEAPLPGIAQLRMLLVEPSARGLHIGEALVRECTRFARQSGYRTLRLWTNSVLLAARGLYRKEGYLLVAREPHRSFGHDLVGETWELALR